MTANNPPQLPGHAIGFQLFNSDDQSVIYLNQAPEGHLLHCQVDNVSDRIIEIAAAEKGRLPGADDFHFALRFRRGLLQSRKEGGFTITATNLPSGWAASEATLGNDGVSIYFLYTAINTDATPVEGPLPATALIPLHGSLVFALLNAQATLRSGSRSTQVELLFQELNYQGEQGSSLHGSRLHLLNVINHMGHRMAPLLFSWVGNHRLLNDGKGQSLRLRILNTQRTQSLLFSEDEEAPTRLVFTSGSEVVKITDVTLETPALSGGGKLVENAGKWSFAADKIGLANIGQDAWLEFELTIAPGTVADNYILHVRYENLPGFWDNSVALPIEVSPISIKDNRIGINTSTPEATLHVVGEPTDSNGKTLVIGDTTKGLNSNLRLGYHKDYSWIQSHGQKPLYINPIPGWVRIGGSSHPTAPLDVSGNINTSGKLTESGHDLMPSGAIIMWSGGNTPGGWVLCDGGIEAKKNAEKQRIVEAKKLKIPDLRERFIVGAGNLPENKPGYPLHSTGGANEYRLRTDQLPAHAHSVNLETDKDGKHRHQHYDTYYSWHNTHAGIGEAIKSYSSAAAKLRNDMTEAVAHKHRVNGTTDPTGDSKPIDNRPQYYALAFIMKL